MAPQAEESARAIVQVRFGSEAENVSECLALLNLPKPQGPHPGNVVVRLTARPVHPYDLELIRKSRLQGRSREIPGMEGVGIVEQVGEGVTSVKKGDRVIPVLLWNVAAFGKGEGSWQDYVEVPEQDAILVPEEMPDDVAAQFIVNPWTAYCLLDDVGASAGNYILQNAGGSVLGRLIIKLAKHRGIKTVNLVRRDELKEELKAIGADEILNVNSEDVVVKVKEVTQGRGVEAAIDMVGGLHSKLAAACVRDNGKLFVIGSLDSNDVTVSIEDLARKVELKLWTLGNFTKEKRQVATEVMQLFKDKLVEPLTGRRFPLEDFKKAIEESEKPVRGGKVILVS